MKNRNNIYRVIAMCLGIGVIAFNLASTAYAATYKTNEDSTAYTYTGQPTASGKTAKISYCAVHPTVKNGSTPRIPFGTVLYIDEIRNLFDPYDVWDMFYSPEGELGYVRVEDIGDPNFTQEIEFTDGTKRKLTLDFVDLYFGTYYQDANDYGFRAIDYHY